MVKLYLRGGRGDVRMAVESFSISKGMVNKLWATLKAKVGDYDAGIGPRLVIGDGLGDHS